MSVLVVMIAIFGVIGLLFGSSAKERRWGPSPRAPVPAAKAAAMTSFRDLLLAMARGCRGVHLSTGVSP